MRRFIVKSKYNEQSVSILKHKNEEKFSFVNMSKGHICPCKFDTEEDAISEMRKRIKEGRIIGFTEIIEI